VFGQMPKSFPKSLRVLDLLRADVKKLTSSHSGVVSHVKRLAGVENLPFLRRLVGPAALEKVAHEGVANCPKLTEMIFGEAPLRELGLFAFADAFSLADLSLPVTLVDVHGGAFEGTAITFLDASECPFLKSFTLSSVPTFSGLILSHSFSGVLDADYAKLVCRATFGFINLADTYRNVVVFGGVRFEALRPPRGEFAAEMFANASIASEMASLLEREAMPARPP
jgi:hypothetical protein